MSWGIIGMTVAGGAIGYAGSEMMGDSAVSGVQLPDFQEPERYEELQDVLSEFGLGALEGDLPEYFAPIGEIGGKTFEDYLGRTLGDVKTGVTEQAARLNQRGGAPLEATAKATGDISSKMRYQDLLRGLQGRQNIMNVGLSTVGNVRDTDVNYAQLQNQFNLNKAGLALGQAGSEDAWQQQKVGMITGGAMGGAQLGTSMWGYGQLADSMGSQPVMGSAGGYDFSDMNLRQQDYGVSPGYADLMRL